ncbi:MAG: GspE/PulE family protein [Spirochaetales bacterium]
MSTERRQITFAEYPPMRFDENQYPLEFVEAQGVVKLRETSEVVVVAVVPTVDESVLTKLEDFHGRPVEVYEVEREEFRSLLSRELAGGDGNEGRGRADTTDAHAIDELANDAPIVNLVNGILLDGVRLGASDIHIDTQRDGAVVRYRVDGVLQTGAPFELGRFPAVSSRIKIMSQLNILERRKPQDGRVTVHVADVSIDMRVSVVPTSTGESIVLRLFNRADRPLSLEELGFTSEGVATLRRLSLMANGLVLVTGPTGSGKTTTLNAMIRELDREHLKIVTIEDPVEYVIEGVDQIQTNDEIGLSFHVLLRRVLRQDPDVIVVGEIRDTETAELAVRAALTGHLVFATLHTNDAASAVTRLVDMGVKPYLLSSVFRAAIAQRLVRRLCEECRREVVAAPASVALAREVGIALEREWAAFGCSRCKETGYRGRLAIHEIIEGSREVEAIIAGGGGTREISDWARAKGIPSMLEVAVAKSVEGRTTMPEIERVVQ